MKILHLFQLQISSSLNNQYSRFDLMFHWIFFAFFHKNFNPPCRASFSFPSGGAWIPPVSLSCLASAWPFSAFPARPQPTAPASSPQRLLEFFPSASGEPSPGSSPESANPKLLRSSQSQYDAAWQLWRLCSHVARRARSSVKTSPQSRSRIAFSFGSPCSHSPQRSTSPATCPKKTPSRRPMAFHAFQSALGFCF